MNLKATSRPPSSLAVGSVALGAALLVLAAATYAVYAFPPLRAVKEAAGNLLLAVAVYLGIFIYAGFRYRLTLSSLLVSAVVGFVGLWFFGFYTGLLVACSFGDCF